MKDKECSVVDIKTIGIYLGIIITITGIMMWRVDASVTDKFSTFKEKLDSNYLDIDVYNADNRTLDIRFKGINEKLDKILRAVK